MKLVIKSRGIRGDQWKFSTFQTTSQRQSRADKLVSEGIDEPNGCHDHNHHHHWPRVDTTKSVCNHWLAQWRSSLQWVLLFNYSWNNFSITLFLVVQCDIGQGQWALIIEWLAALGSAWLLLYWSAWSTNTHTHTHSCTGTTGTNDFIEMGLVKPIRANNVPKQQQQQPSILLA